MSRLLDPEWDATAEAGDIVSQINQALERFKTLVERLSRGKKAEARVLKRGTLEIRQLNESFIAAYEPEPRNVEINGVDVPSKPGQGHRAVGTDPYQALIRLAGELKKKEALG